MLLKARLISPVVLIDELVEHHSPPIGTFSELTHGLKRLHWRFFQPRTSFRSATIDVVKRTR
jgi:hypothetical protein